LGPGKKREIPASKIFVPRFAAGECAQARLAASPIAQARNIAQDDALAGNSDVYGEYSAFKTLTTKNTGLP